MRANAYLTVVVIATQTIDCTQIEFGPPMISSDSDGFEIPVSAEVTLNCQYTANPIVTIYKWQQQYADSVILESTNHYTVNQYTLTIHNVTVQDAGVFHCNVTNQCGYNTVAHLVSIIGKYKQHYILIYICFYL